MQPDVALRSWQRELIRCTICRDVVHPEGAALRSAGVDHLHFYCPRCAKEARILRDKVRSDEERKTWDWLYGYRGRLPD